MTMTESIDQRLKTFKASSAFTPGDPLSFSVQISEDVNLPGRYDPNDYIQKLGVDLTDKNVLVVCPGNGGLCTASIQSGASTVVALEPRVVYQQSLSSVAAFTSEVLGTTFSQRSLGEKLVESFDVVFWAEGLDEIVHPKKPLETVLRAMSPGGILFLELAHGHHGKLPESINSWRPSAEDFAATIADFEGLSIVGQLEGRDQVRTIYRILNNAVRDEPVVDSSAVDVVHESTVEVSEPSEDTVDEAVEQEVPVDHSTASDVADKIKQIMDVDGDDLDVIYEGRASTPKSSKKKRGRRRPRGGRGKSKD